MHNKVNQYIKTNNLTSNDNPLVVGVSAGVDSVCLLHVLIKLGYHVILAHVNHHKREASALEEKAMENLAKKYEIPYECYHYYDQNNGNFHDDAHNSRYTFFKKVADKYNTDIIVTAHHLDDQIETILIKLLNGSNLYGYGGISNKLEDTGYKIIRPLLCVTKEEIYNYAKQNNIEYFEDESNNEDDYLRNKLRHNIVPILKNIEPNILEKFQEFSIQAKEAFNYIRLQSIKYLDETNNKIELDSYLNLNPALQKDILCLLFERYPIRKNNEIITQCYNFLLNSFGNKRIALKNSFYLVLSYNEAYISKQENPDEFNEKLTLDNEVIFMKKYRFYFSKKIPQNNAKYIKLCYNGLKFPFFVRTRKDGDFIKMSYGNKKVSKLMIDHKLTTNERLSTPLIYDGEGNLLWVVPIAKSLDVVNQKFESDIFLVCEDIKNEK